MALRTKSPSGRITPPGFVPLGMGDNIPKESLGTLSTTLCPICGIKMEMRRVENRGSRNGWKGKYSGLVLKCPIHGIRGRPL